MDTSRIREYAKLMEEMGLSALEIDEDDVSLRLERPVPTVNVTNVAAEVPAQATAQAAVQQAENAIMRAPETSLMTSGAATESGTDGTDETDAAGGDYITSPMVGVFHAVSEDGSEPLAKAGDKVKKGDTVCIIEAMKLMNEIIAEEDATIEKVLVRDGQLVEYGTKLFKISK